MTPESPSAGPSGSPGCALRTTTRVYATTSTREAVVWTAWPLSMETGSAAPAAGSLLRVAEQAPATVESALMQLVSMKAGRLSSLCQIPDTFRCQSCRVSAAVSSA